MDQDNPNPLNLLRSQGGRLRPYRSKKQKPCNACRQRRGGCVREGNSACTFCAQKNLACVVETSANERPHSTTISRVVQYRETLSNSQQDQRELAAIEQEQSDGINQLDNTPKRTAQHIGPTSDHDTFILRHSSRRFTQESVDGMWMRWMSNSNSSNPVHFAAFPDEHLDVYPSYYPRNIVEASVKSFRDELVKAYFEYVHASFALLGPQTPLTIANYVTLRTSIYCLAQRHCGAAHDLDPWLFTDFNKQALNIERHAPKLETIEAALLFAQRHAYLIRAPTMPGMCAEVGSIIGMSHDLGLNLDPIDWDLTDTEKRRRRRLWWGVYIQDKWSALTLGRPSYLHDTQSDVSMLTIADFAAEGCSEPTSPNLQPARHFISMATLTIILSKILDYFFTVQAMNSRTTKSEVKITYERFEFQLEDWRVKHLEPLLAHKSFPDPSGSLELAFYTVQITLQRGAVGAINQQSSAVDPFWIHIRQQGKNTASSVISLLEGLPVARSAAFWWSASKLNFSIAGSFMISMFLYSVSDEDSQYWIDKVTFYRKLLRAHSTGFEITKHASIRLDLLVDRGVQKSPLSRANSPRQSGRETARSEDGEKADTFVFDDTNEDWLLRNISLSPSGVFCWEKGNTTKTHPK